jgi:hypothetical protein
MLAWAKTMTWKGAHPIIGVAESRDEFYFEITILQQGNRTRIGERKRVRIKPNQLQG